MRNCNMPNCNMPRYDMPRNMANSMPNNMDRYMCEHTREGVCECDDYPIGMGYVPWQEFKELHDPERGYHSGTIFIELEKPFTGRRSFKR